MPGLDLARALAIVLVLCYHGLANSGVLGGGLTLKGRLLDLAASVGAHGVHLFFVLSGFLITSILIESRERPTYYSNFYFRRMLRILPALALLLAFLRSTGQISWAFFWAAALYAANLARLFGTYTEYGALWSLSVEEQFYLVWPFVVRRASRSLLTWICIAMIVLTPLLRFGLLFAPKAFSDVTYKTWAVWDFFAAGAMLAIGIRQLKSRPTLFRIAAACLTLGIFGVVLFELLLRSSRALTSKLVAATAAEPWLLVCTGVVLLAFLLPSWARVPMAAPALFLAKISYGLYLVHPLVFKWMDTWWPIGGTGSASWLLMTCRFLAESGLAIIIAALSRFSLEEFMLRLKSKPWRSSSSIVL